MWDYALFGKGESILIRWEQGPAKENVPERNLENGKVDEGGESKTLKNKGVWALEV